MTSTPGQHMAVELTRELIRFDTRNPPGDERACAEALATRLEAAGFSVARYEFADRRTSLVARIGGAAGRRPLCLTGHLDVVPTGAAPWARDPFAGEIGDGRIHGRGSSDMKAGVAAMVVAALASAKRLARSPGLTLVFTAGEETGCEGAFDLARRGVLGQAGAIVVGEPTANAPFVGHKGCLRFRCIASGVTAHSSMPELGDNAIYKAARAISALERLDLSGAAHPVVGQPTLVVSQVHGGMNINSVPDRAEIGVDVRTVPGQDLAQLRAQAQAAIGDAIAIEPIVEVPSMVSSADDEWVQSVFAAAHELTGAAPATRIAPYFTDGSVLRPAFGGPPAVILGPGEGAQAHQTDEYCSIARIEQAVALYERLISEWAQAGGRAMSDAERADQTSAALARPIAESYWVLPGLLLAGEYPGAREPAAAERKLPRLLDAGVTCFIDLTEANEGLRPYWPLAQALTRDYPTVEHQRWPIRDLDVPTIAHMAGILSAIDRALAAGQVVYLHCWGGIGRTGTVVACSLIERGLAASVALERLTQLRQGTPDSQRRSPETDAQRAFVLAWQPR